MSLRARIALRTPRFAAGFTIIEVLIVIVILGVVIAMGLPSMRDLIASTKVKDAASDVFASLIFARSEAVKRNGNIDVVPNDASNWGQGWKVKLSTTDLKVQDPITGDIAVTGPAATITYRGNGRLTATSGVSFTFVATSYPQIQTRCVSIDPSGRPAVRTDTDFNPANGCN